MEPGVYEALLTDSLRQQLERAPDLRAAYGNVDGSEQALAITRHLIHMHGGSIEVHSQVDKGSTFSVRLPVDARQMQVAASGNGQEA